MRLFIKDQLLFFIFYIGMLAIINLVYWLDREQNLVTTWYANFLSTLFFLLFLAIRYIKHRRMYAFLEKETQALDELNNPIGQAALPQAFEGMLKRTYRLHEEQLRLYEQKYNEHVTFIRQWVHQMKTPLSVIQLTLQDEDTEPARQILEETEKMRRGLQTVLYLARLDTFERDFYVTKVNLWKAAQQAVQENKGMFIRHHVYPQLEISNPCWVETDEKWCVFIINQLLTNAIRYSGDPEKKVMIRAYSHGINKVLEVEDQGIGIMEQDLRRVFDPFFTGSNGRIVRESTGMGLYLVKQVCDKLGHSIHLTSSPGQGTKVTLIFHGAVH